MVCVRRRPLRLLITLSISPAYPRVILVLLCKPHALGSAKFADGLQKMLYHLAVLAVVVKNSGAMLGVGE